MIRKGKRFFPVFVLFLILSESAAHQKRMMADPYRSFSNNINTCLFNNWPQGILNGNVACNSPGDVQLCYGQYNGGRALFAVCYNTNTLIAEFTGHELQKGGTVGAANMIDPPDAYDEKWKTDEGLVQQGTPVAVDADYDPYSQAGKFANYNVGQNQFLARGHLSPNGDFSKANGENSFTYVTTNIAPQWQPFNMGNWANLEKAVKAYAGQKQGRVLYVFTGTGGKAQYNNADIKLNNKVLTPRYYWKAVCDPQAKQSIVFVAENIPGEISDNLGGGCNGKQQTSKLGIIQCYALNDAQIAHPDFKLPPFGDEKCNPANRGIFLDQILQSKLK